jgi:hypothetical protein
MLTYAGTDVLVRDVLYLALLGHTDNDMLTNADEC